MKPKLKRPTGKRSVDAFGGKIDGKDRSDSKPDPVALDLAIGVGNSRAAASQVGNLWSGVVGQIHALLEHRRRSAARRRHRRLHRRGTFDGPSVREKLGRRHRQSVDLPAGFRRTSAGDHRTAGSFGRRGDYRHRLDGRTRSQSRNRRRDGTVGDGRCERV